MIQSGGVMVIFNDPVPAENPALQAVLMALDMRTAIGAMIAKWRLLGHDLGFGIGVAHGICNARHDWLRRPLRLCGDWDGFECRVPTLRRSQARSNPHQSARYAGCR